MFLFNTMLIHQFHQHCPRGIDRWWFGKGLSASELAASLQTKEWLPTASMFVGVTTRKMYGSNDMRSASPYKSITIWQTYHIYRISMFWLYLCCTFIYDFILLHGLTHWLVVISYGVTDHGRSSFQYVNERWFITHEVLWHSRDINSLCNTQQIKNTKPCFKIIHWILLHLPVSQCVLRAKGGCFPDLGIEFITSYRDSLETCLILWL